MKRVKARFKLRLECPNRAKARGIERQEHGLITGSASRESLLLQMLETARLCHKCGAPLVGGVTEAK